MRGLVLAKEFYQEFGAPLLQKMFAAQQERIAAGLVGDGSDCLGFDDKYSTDHDWGPGFCWWLNKTDYEQFGAQLQTEYAKLTTSFHGFERKTSEWGDGRVGVFEIGTFYRGFLGRNGVPSTLADWLRIPEKNLAACTSGEVFVDPLGEFSKIRQQLLQGYPEDVRLAKIAARCMSCGQAGQYNFHRSIWRGEYFAAQYAETKFCSDIMSLVYLLNRSYAPFYKWLHRGVATLPILGRFMAQKVTALTATCEYEEKKFILDEIISAVIVELQSAGLSDSDSKFLVDHGPVVHSRIVDPGLRQLNVWVG
ncbi:conserved protein of unknown function [Georgfuchsia toluolica]|uniref:DUF4037 domain-containing protein n=1 Tax=Georgfuchsia toluolica TaxID=424218 RepID=A0A916NGF3_9PROT|nr:DUF4037 domain-containing protein [Georgfuchsia toluolica]CAG4882127.1 conserved protein of unknown function [Georgfuchsia toluolica]CAG4885455.1 conserved protein of unknown function [Georgfuchsia toluolica]